MRLKIILCGLILLLLAPSLTPANGQFRNLSREEAVEIAKKSAVTAYKSIAEFDFTVRETKKVGSSFSS